jgi:pimeloyl-ACP methyl ester carboxylesterase
MQLKPLALRACKSLAPLAMLPVAAFAALLLALSIEHRISVALPAPTGPFAVGRAIYDWSDDATRDRLGPVAGTKRELLVWVWYPAAPGPSAATDDYLPVALRTEIERHGGVLAGKFLTRDRSKVHGHSLRNPPVSAQQLNYPVVLLRAGASLEVANYSTLAEDLASHGYVVVGFDAPYRTSIVAFPDGRIIRRLPENNPEHCLEKTGPEQEDCANRILRAWTADMALVLNRMAQLNALDPSGQFTARLDMTRVGVFGHSFGGAAAALFCHQDWRCKAGIDVDGAPHGSVIQAGIDRPFMFLMSDHSREADPESAQIRANIQSIYDRLPAEGRVQIVIQGANHFLFGDDGALLKSHLILGTLRTFGFLGMEGRRQLAVTAYCVDRFFDNYLKGTNLPPIEFRSSLYPEVQVLE